MQLKPRWHLLLPILRGNLRLAGNSHLEWHCLLRLQLDGVNVDWYYEYPVGNAVIIPPDQATSIVLAGPGNGEGLNITNADVVLAWYYWNGSAWVPAPSTGLLKVMTLTNNLKPGDETTEYVSNAWVYWSNGTAVVSWPQPINQTPSVPAPPGFSP